nr:c-type cytochrome [Mesobacterium pallidum]
MVQMASAGSFGLGRPALEEEIAAWNLDVSPDGTGLPVGSGDVMTGDEVFAENCAVCHGDFAEGRGNWPKLAGGEGTLNHKDPLKTVGSYWPHLSTTWDYVNRSMPFGAAQTLEPDQVYAITAYILYSNDLVDEDFVLSNENFLEVAMPNADGFIIDDRAETEYPIWRTEPCMENCKESVEITMRAAVLDVTPEEEGAAEEAAAEPATDAPAAVEVTEAAAPEAPAEEVPVMAALNMDLVEDGENVFKKCKACHQVGDGATNKTGPVLNGVYGAPIGHVEDFRYSKDMEAMGEAGQVWNDETLATFLAKPKDFIPKTKMSFNGLRKDEEITAVIEYLKSVSR